MEFTEFLSFIAGMGVDAGVLIAIIGFSEITKRTVKFSKMAKLNYFYPIIFAALGVWAVVSPFSWVGYYNAVFKYGGIAMLIYNLCKNAAFYKKIFPETTTETPAAPVENKEGTP